MSDLDNISTLEELHINYKDKLPVHLGLILDGNRRWITRKGSKDVTKGHIAGYQTLKSILYPIFQAGIPYLSVYALSNENVKYRTEKEVKYLFKLIIKGVEDVLSEPLIREKRVRVRLIGRLHNLPKEIQEKIEKMNRATEKYHDNFINFCVLYDGQDEIVDAVKKIIRSKIPMEEINRSTIKQNLYTYDFPELDYIIRTGMEDGARLSGFLLWDSSYAEFKFRSDLWPDYNKDMLLEDLKAYLKRNRRIGR
ncbi:MAG: di-trans,poly-cis-decaprenylcistransferase [Candidatus Lokiarchaeota archaeon]|nr:di-trans,poly-cis-decaprenylcistransferase [Candidatus Lokiarchaeota archaeon]